jgi:hypothetical protein
VERYRQEVLGRRGRRSTGKAEAKAEARRAQSAAGLEAALERMRILDARRQPQPHPDR